MLPGGEIPPEGEAPQAPDHGPEQSGSHPCLGDSKLFLYLLPAWDCLEWPSQC